MDFLIFALAYAIIIFGFVVVAGSDVAHDPQDDFYFNDSRWSRLPKQKVG